MEHDFPVVFSQQKPDLNDGNTNSLDAQLTPNRLIVRNRNMDQLKKWTVLVVLILGTAGDEAMGIHVGQYVVAV